MSFVFKLFRRLLVKLSPAFYDSRNRLYTDFTVQALKPKGAVSIRLLDAGGYDGALADICRKNLAGQGLNVFAVVLDFSVQALNRGHRVYRDLNFVCADFNHMPFKAGSFDLVCSISVFEHLSAPEKAVGEIAFVSRGSCIIQIPNMQYFVEPHTKTPFLFLLPDFAKKKVGQLTGVPYLLNFSVCPASLTRNFQQAAFGLTKYFEVYHAGWTRLLRFPQGYLMRFERHPGINP